MKALNFGTMKATSEISAISVSVSKDENENVMIDMLSSAFVLPMAMALSKDVKSDITT